MLQQDNRIIESLKENGYSAQWDTLVKNGISLNAVVIETTGNYSPIIYTDELLTEEDTIESAVDKILMEFEEIKDSIPSEPTNILSRNYFLENITIALQKNSTEKIVKRESGLDGLEAYLVIIDTVPQIDGNLFSFKILPDLLEYCQLTEEEAWEQAEKNLEKSVVITDMEELLGIPLPGAAHLYIATNKSSVKGAAVVLVHDIMQKFAEKHHTHRIALLPSSIHEMLLIPDADDIDKAALLQMVKDCNRKEVAPEDRLIDQVYYMEF